MYLFFNLIMKSLERPRWCHSAVSISSCGGFILTPLLYKTTSKAYLHLNTHTYLASCVYDLLDRSLFLTKKIEQEKKSLDKSISKLIHVDAANTYLFKVNDIVLVFLLLTLNINYNFFYCFSGWLWTSKY